MCMQRRAGRLYIYNSRIASENPPRLTCADWDGGQVKGPQPLADVLENGRHAGVPCKPKAPAGAGRAGQCHGKLAFNLQEPAHVASNYECLPTGHPAAIAHCALANVQPAYKLQTATPAAHRFSPSTAKPPHSEALRVQGVRIDQCCAGVSATLRRRRTQCNMLTPDVATPCGRRGRLQVTNLHALAAFTTHRPPHLTLLPG